MTRPRKFRASTTFLLRTSHVWGRCRSRSDSVQTSEHGCSRESCPPPGQLHLRQRLRQSDSGLPTQLSCQTHLPEMENEPCLLLQSPSFWESAAWKTHAPDPAQAQPPACKPGPRLRGNVQTQTGAAVFRNLHLKFSQLIPFCLPNTIFKMCKYSEG